MYLGQPRKRNQRRAISGPDEPGLSEYGIPSVLAMMDAAFSPTARAVEYVFADTLLGQIERSNQTLTCQSRSSKVVRKQE